MRCCITSSHEVVQRAVLPSPPSHISVVGADRIEALERDNASLKLSADAISDSLDEDKEMLQALAQGQGTIRGTASSTTAHIGSMSGPRLFVATQRSIHCGFGCWDTFRHRHHEAYGPQWEHGHVRETHTSSSETFTMSTMSDLELPSVIHSSTRMVVQTAQLAGIVSYFIAHFRKHQSSNDPSDWYNVDIQLFTAHMTHDTFCKSFTTKDHPSDQLLSICRNGNDVDKGCVLEEMYSQTCLS